MAKTGFVIHNGIKQIFTSGPSSGNPVVNGYAINGTLQGPTVNYAQSFVVNSLETISAGGRVWVRKEEDQTKCAPDCNAPTVSTLVKDCSTNIFTVTSTNVNATNSPNTRVEVSTNNFATILSTFNRSNSNGTNNYNIDLSNSGIVRGTTIYFRLVNLCSPTLSSSPSSIVSDSCEVIPCCTPTLNGVSIDGSTLYVGWTLGAGSCLPVSAMTVQTSTDQVTWTSSTGSPTSPRTFGIPTVTTYYRVISNCLGGGTSAASNVLSYGVAPPPPPPPPPTTVRLTWNVGLYGGYGDGSFGISVNGISVVTSNVTDNSYIDVPLNSEIFAYVSAPSMYVEGNMVPQFNSHVYAVGPNGDVIIRDNQPTNPTAQISFTITGETSIYADASAFNEGQPEIN